MAAEPHHDHVSAYHVAALVVMTLAATGCGARSGLDSEASNGSPEADLCIEAPHRAHLDPLEISFTAKITSADVVLLLDTTSSMDGELRQIRRKLRGEIVPALLETIPDLEIAVAAVQEFPIARHGGGGDKPFRLWQPMTSDVDSVREALDAMELGHGGDHAEAQVEALYQVATGAGLEGHIPPADCPAHTVGYPCFRREGARIILLFTDSLFHNGPSGEWPYEVTTFEPATYEQTLGALRRIGARVLGLYGGFRYRKPEPRTDLEAVARDTGAIGPDGEPIVFDIGADGDSLDEGVVETVRELVNGVPMDVDLLVEDHADDDFDATRFVRSVTAFRARPAGSARARGDHFDNVEPGTRVTFRLELHNDVVPQAESPQRFLLRLTLRGDRRVRVRSRLVEIAVPPRSGEGCVEGGRG